MSLFVIYTFSPLFHPFPILAVIAPGPPNGVNTDQGTANRCDGGGHGAKVLNPDIPSRSRDQDNTRRGLDFKEHGVWIVVEEDVWGHGATAFSSASARVGPNIFSAVIRCSGVNHFSREFS